MITIHAKPVSLNEAYRGRRFATQKLKDYEKEVWYQLPDLEIPKGKLFLTLEFGFSSKGSDADNAVNCFVDILAKRYEFNDNRVYRLEVEKIDVPKKSEYIKFSISKYAQ